MTLLGSQHRRGVSRVELPPCYEGPEERAERAYLAAVELSTDPDIHAVLRRTPEEWFDMNFTGNEGPLFDPEQFAARLLEYTRDLRAQAEKPGRIATVLGWLRKNQP